MGETYRVAINFRVFREPTVFEPLARKYRERKIKLISIPKNTHSHCVSKLKNSPYPIVRLKQTAPKKTDTHSQCVFNPLTLFYYQRLCS